MLSIPNLKDICSLILETNNPHKHTVGLDVINSRRIELEEELTYTKGKRNGWELNIKWMLKNRDDHVQDGLICLEIWRNGETLCTVKLN
jgi:hypothetical protein